MALPTRGLFTNKSLRTDQGLYPGLSRWWLQIVYSQRLIGFIKTVLVDRNGIVHFFGPSQNTSF